MTAKTNPAVVVPVLAGGQPATEVLVPIHRAIWDDRGAATAARFAAHWGLPLRIVHVATPEDALVEPNLRWAEINYANPKVDVVESGPDVDVAVAIASAASPGSLVMMSTDNVHQWLTVPSVGEAVIRTLGGPLVLCGPHAGVSEPIGSVVMGLDGSAAAESALAPAVTLAASLEATLWLVKVVDAATSRQVAKLRDQGQRVSESGYLREKADELAADGVAVGWEVVHSDDTAPALAEFATDRHAAMIVAGSHGASGVSKRVFGSVSLGLVEHSTVPVMIARSSESEPELTEGGTGS